MCVWAGALLLLDLRPLQARARRTAPHHELLSQAGVTLGTARCGPKQEREEGAGRTVQRGRSTTAQARVSSREQVWLEDRAWRLVPGAGPCHE